MSDISLEALERFKNVPERFSWERRQRIAISITQAAAILRNKGIELPAEKISRTSFETQVRDARQNTVPVNPYTLRPEVVQHGAGRRLESARQDLETVEYPHLDLSPETVQDRNQEGYDDVQKAA